VFKTLLIKIRSASGTDKQPEPDPHESRTGSRYEWLACGTPLGCRLQASSVKISSMF